MTSWSLNCSRMSSQMGVGGSSSIAADCQLLQYNEAQSGILHTIASMLFSRCCNLCSRQSLSFGDSKKLEHLRGGFGVGVFHGGGNCVEN